MEQTYKRLEAIGYINEAPGLMAMGKSQQAIQCYHKALVIAETIRDKYLEAICCCNLGNAYHLPGRDEEAISFLNRALSIPGATVEMMQVQVCSHCYLCEIYATQRAYNKAREQGEHALNVAQAMQSKDDLAKAFVALADLYRVVGDSERAIWHYKKALEPIVQTGAKYLEYTCGFHLAGIVISQITEGKSVSRAERDETKKHLERSIQIATEIGNEQAVTEAKSCHGRLCRLTEQYPVL